MTFGEKRLTLSTRAPLLEQSYPRISVPHRQTHTQKELNKREGDRVAMKILSKGILTLIPYLVGFFIIIR